MADQITKLSALVNPQVLADMIAAKVEKKIKVVPFARVDTTLQGRPGDTITIPQFVWSGEATEVAEGAEIPIRELGSKTAQYQIKKAGIGGTLTDEALESGYGDPQGALTTGIANSIASKIDTDSMDELLKSTTVVSKSTAISYDNIVDGIDAFGEEENSEKIIFIAPNQVSTLRKDDDFIDKTKYGNEVMMTGEIGIVGNARVVPSKRVNAIGGYYYNPIVKLTNDPESEDDMTALSYFVKRDTNVEIERKPRVRSTEITGDQMYVVALTNESKVALLKTSGATLTAITYGEDTYNYPGIEAGIFNAKGITGKVTRTGDTAVTFNIRGIIPKCTSTAAAAVGFAEGTTHASVMLVEIPEAGLNFDYTKVKYNGNAILESDIEQRGNNHYLALVTGLKDDEGSIVLASGSTNFTLAYGTTTYTYTYDFTGATLAE